MLKTGILNPNIGIPLTIEPHVDFKKRVPSAIDLVGTAILPNAPT